jgi:hypothetical protein
LENSRCHFYRATLAHCVFHGHQVGLTRVIVLDGMSKWQLQIKRSTATSS